LLRVRLQNGESPDHLFGLGKWPIGHADLGTIATNSRSQGGGQAAFGCDQPTSLHPFFDQFAHRRHLFLARRGIALNMFVNTQELHRSLLDRFFYFVLILQCRHLALILRLY
jgi:hypothetical protein